MLQDSVLCIYVFFALNVAWGCWKWYSPDQVLPEWSEDFSSSTLQDSSCESCWCGFFSRRRSSSRQGIVKALTLIHTDSNTR